MFDSDILEVSIGVVFVFVLISTVCSAAREGLEAWLKTRASYLEFGIRQLLNDPNGVGIARQLFEHPLVSGLYVGEYEADKGAPKGPLKRRFMARDSNLPSYIPARNFAVALMDIAARGPVNGSDTDVATQRISLANIRENIASIGNPHVQRALLTAVDSAQGDLNRVQANLEAWYDSAMDRVSGWYKRSTSKMLLFIALFISVGMNVNTISIADYLYRHDSVRSTIVAGVEKSAGDSATQKLAYDDARKQLDAMHLPMGWSGENLEASWGAPRTRGERAAAVVAAATAAGAAGASADATPATTPTATPSTTATATATPPSTAQAALSKLPWNVWDDVFGPLVGWLITALAATLGAPFWFDVLNKFMVIRSTVKPHEKSGEEGSEDRKVGEAPAPAAPPPGSAAALAAAALAAASSNASSAAPSTSAADPHEDSCGVGAPTMVTPDSRLPPASGGVT